MSEDPQKPAAVVAGQHHELTITISIRHPDGKDGAGDRVATGALRRAGDQLKLVVPDMLAFYMQQIVDSSDDITGPLDLLVDVILNQRRQPLTAATLAAYKAERDADAAMGERETATQH